ncbi:MAG: hypothetical protein WBO23_06140 [Burkholderiales bacterium]
MMRLASLFAAALSALLAPAALRAEPYLAVRTGAKCMACHVNPTGGGKRTEFGATYGQTALPAERLDLAAGGTVPAGGPEPAVWTGKLNDHFAIGSDLRANARATFTPHATDAYAFDLVRAQVYLEVKPIVDRLTIYLDERVAPGAASNRETYAMLWTADRSAYVKAGRMFVPFGLRVEDDTAFIRQASGTSFNSSDDGVEVGLETTAWSAQVSMTNGAGGGTETNRGKLASALASYVRPDWRAGASASTNFSGAADRRMQSAFAGLRTGGVAWLVSGLRVTDDGTPTGRIEQRASLLEANVGIAKGHNLKLSYEYLDPDRDVREDHRERFSAVWEVTPFQFTQFRAGVRKNHGIPQNDALNATEVFLQWHAFF